MIERRLFSTRQDAAVIAFIFSLREPFLRPIIYSVPMGPVQAFISLFSGPQSVARTPPPLLYYIVTAPRGRSILLGASIFISPIQPASQSWVNIWREGGGGERAS